MAKRIGLLLSVLVLGLFTAAPARAITNGVPDDGEHPYVGQLLFYVPDDVDPRFTDPGSWYNCSGTLLSPTIVLTAGHCTYGVGDEGTPTTDTGGSGGTDVWVNFSEVPNYDGLPPSADYVPDDNEQRYDDWVAWLQSHPEWVHGTAYPHPQYDDNAFFLHDLGVVVLDHEVQRSTYGLLPEEGLLNTFLTSRHSEARFTAVGYGLEKVLPWAQIGGDRRMKANVFLVSLRGTFGVPYGTSAVFSNNKGAGHTGGTCFGDSGGPVFIRGTSTVVAVTSFGLSPNCTGADGAYRVDTPDDLNWLADAFGLTP